MIRILHAADLHLDSPFAAMTPDRAKLRRAEQRQVLVRLVEECNRRSCHLLLLAGDLFDSEQVYRETAELLCQLLKNCHAKVFISPGNHDYWSPASLYATIPWPKNVHIFRSEQIEAVKLENPNVTVYGAAFTGPCCGPLLHGFRAAQGPAVMVVHGELSDRSGKYNPISVADVAGSGLNYLALGHIHEDSLRRVGSTSVGIPGCAMGRGFDETDEKGAFYVELDAEGCRVSPVPLGATQYRICTVPVKEDPLQSILDTLPTDSADHIYRIILKGTCPKPDLEQLRQALAQKCAALELVDQTEPPADLWASVGEDNLKGAFLRRLQPVYEQAAGEDRQTVSLAVRIGLALMEGREVPTE